MTAKEKKPSYSGYLSMSVIIYGGFKIRPPFSFEKGFTGGVVTAPFFRPNGNGGLRRPPSCVF